MNIIFTKYYLKKCGGLEKYCFKLIDAFLEKGYKITLLTTFASQDLLNKKGLKIVLIKPFGFFKFLKLKSFDLKCQKWLKENSFKLIFAFDRTTLFTHSRLGNGLHFSFLQRRKLFESFFKTFLNKINPLHRTILNIEKKSFSQKALKMLFVNSHMVKQELINKYSIDQSNIEVVHNGVDFFALAKTFKNWQIIKKDFLQKLQLNPLDTQLLFIGNGFKRKGLLNLLKALALIKKESFHLSVVGKDKNIKKYIKITKKLHLDKKVSFFNERSDINNFYSLADIFILPSFYDPFANVTLEALAMGNFVITSHYNGAKEILTKTSGKLVDILNIESFSKEIKNSLNKKKTNILAENIRRSVKHLDFSNQLAYIVKKASDL